MSYYPEPGGHVRDKIKVVFDLSNYANKKELEQFYGRKKPIKIWDVDVNNIFISNLVKTRLILLGI